MASIEPIDVMSLRVVLNGEEMSLGDAVSTLRQMVAVEHESDLTALRSILSRVREWVDGAALVETEEREIRGILEEGKP
jgi:hypothetical protein